MAKETHGQLEERSPARKERAEEKERTGQGRGKETRLGKAEASGASPPEEEIGGGTRRRRPTTKRRSQRTRMRRSEEARDRGSKWELSCDALSRGEWWARHFQTLL